MEIEEIEHVISKSQFVKTGVIVPMYKRNEDVVDYLLAVIVPANHTFEKEFELTSAIKKELSNTLPGYMVPRKMFYRNELPITPNGKIDRKRLKAEVSV
jgi:D-alanine--poly(phosphoribitol) ligase subunit 1